jgi:2-methylisocitrate lyase-like PEP mutase family enzyme
VKPATEAATFRGLHDGPEILVLPGVWDVASARLFAAEGFGALGTTSAGVAWSLGHATGQDVPWPHFLERCSRVARAVDVPVSFDIEAGFADTAEGVCENVREAIEAGACGINLEDGVEGGRLREPELVVDAIRAIRGLCAKLGFPLFVNARTDVYLGGIAEEARRLPEAIRRGRLYAQAGADGFFVPGLAEVDAIRSVVAEVPLPLNVYALRGVPAAEGLGELGVRRVSVGCGPLQAVLARTRAIARALRHDGDWSSFTHDWLDYGEAVELCSGAARRSSSVGCG